MSIASNPILAKNPTWGTSEVKKAADEFIDDIANQSKEETKKLVHDTIDCCANSLQAADNYYSNSSLESLKDE